MSGHGRRESGWIAARLAPQRSADGHSRDWADDHGSTEAIPPAVPQPHHGLLRRLPAYRDHLCDGRGRLLHLPEASRRTDLARAGDNSADVPVHERFRVVRAQVHHAPADQHQRAARGLRAPHAQPPPVLHRRGNALPRSQGLARHRLSALCAGRLHPDVDPRRVDPRVTSSPPTSAGSSCARRRACT